MLRELFVLYALSAGWLICSRRSYGPIKRSFFIIFFLGLLFEVASPGKFYIHYYQYFLPLFSIMGGLFFYDLYYIVEKRVARSMRVALTVSFVAFLVAGAFLVYNQISFLRMTHRELSIAKYGPSMMQSKAMGEFIGKKTLPCETIYEWGKDTSIYFYAKRRAAAGVIFIDILFMGTPTGRERRRRAVREAVYKNPPAYLIYNTHTRWLSDDIFDDLLREEYRHVGLKFQRYHLYERKSRVKECKEGLGV